MSESRSRRTNFGLLVAFWCALPAGLSHAAPVKASPAAARLKPSGGFIFGAAGGLTPLSAQPLPSLPSAALPVPAAGTPALSRVALPPPAVPGSLPPVLAPALPAPAARGALRADGPSRNRRRSEAAASAMESLRAAAGAEEEGPRPELQGEIFDGAASAPRLPAYLRAASPEDSAFLARVYEEALRSRTGRAVLKRVEELTGAGRQPVILELFDYRDNTEGDLTPDWELVRLERGFMKSGPRSAAPTFIHELTHVLQIAEGLPHGALELELEAFLHSLKVAKELGVRFKRGHFLEDASRAFRRSLKDFIELIEGNYEGSFTLVNSSLDKVEERLLRDKKSSERAIREHEADLRERQDTYRALRAAGHPRRALQAYHASYVKGNQVRIQSEEDRLYWTAHDLRILYTEAGRRRYLEYSRDVLSRMRAFHRRNRVPSRRLGERLLLPPAESGKTFQPRPPGRGRPARPAARPPEEPAEGAPSLPEGLRVLPGRGDESWAARALARLRDSEAGRALLEAAAAEALRAGRPFVLDVFHTGRDHGTDYYWDIDVLTAANRHRRLPLSEAAALLAQGLAGALGSRRAAYHALEPQLDAWATALTVARELGVRIRRGNPLYWAARQFRKAKLDRFIAWARKSLNDSVLLSGFEGTSFREVLERDRRSYERLRRRDGEYLRQRRSTLALMRAVRHPRWATKSYRANEVLETETRLSDHEAGLAWIEHDLALLDDPARLEAYRAYAAEAMERLKRLHAAYREKKR